MSSHRIAAGPHGQHGASLIEVLVAVLILSFGMLSLGGMLSYAVQLPKLSAYRATAMSIAAAHVERMRANIGGFKVGDNYIETLTYKVTPPAFTGCVHPSCDAALLAALDKNETNVALNRALPDGGMRLICPSACSSGEGEMWVMWTEPTTFASISGTSSDECPDPAVLPTFSPFTAPVPRCVHIKFRL